MLEFRRLTKTSFMVATKMSDKNNPAVVNLGWENGWSETPEIVKRCKALGHKPQCVNQDPTHHGLKHEVRCDICGYVYWYDSSD